MVDTSQRNPVDPLHRGSEEQRLLFGTLGQVCNGHSAESVIGAAQNLMINAVRMSHGDRQKAEARFDEIFGRAKTMLLEHYDPVTGRVRKTIPFTQVVNMPLLSDDDMLPGSRRKD